MVTPVLTEPFACPTARVTICAGKNFRVESPPGNALVTPELAAEVAQVLERFGRIVRSVSGTSVGVFFRPGIFGHHKVGRAVDIYAVGGLGLDTWKRLWDAAEHRCCQVSKEAEKRAIWDNERRKNLGWQLYKALQIYGRWSQPRGYPVQLFGPWTRREGPWKPISDFLLNAHRDHIHAAK
jgi:hypothetical protein